LHACLPGTLAIYKYKEHGKDEVKSRFRAPAGEGAARFKKSRLFARNSRRTRRRICGTSRSTQIFPKVEQTGAAGIALRAVTCRRASGPRGLAVLPLKSVAGSRFLRHSLTPGYIGFRVVASPEMGGGLRGRRQIQLLGTGVRCVS
jgi:hypothetical protein